MKEGVYHLEVLTVSRGDGRSAPGAIAYRAGIVIEDLRTGEKFDYRRKRGIRHTEIVLPKGAPSAYADRAFLWNEAERKEKHPRATVARELVLAIPAHLSKEQQLELVRKFVYALVDKHQVAVDFAIHDPHEKDSDNVHVHVMITTRRLTETGFTEKTREWDDIKKLGPQTTKETRKLWADLSNAALAEAGIDMFIDHRSHKDRGLETAPTKKMGVAATAMEKRGEASDRGDINRSIRAANAAIESAKREHAIVQDQIEQITQAPAKPDAIDQVEPETLPIVPVQQVATPIMELPMPDDWMKLSPVHEHILNGPSYSPALTPEPVATTAPQTTRADKEREYQELQQLQKQVTAYWENRTAAVKGRNKCEAMKADYDKMAPPRFSMMLKFIGFNELYDDYLEQKRDAAIAMQKKALQVKDLEAKRDELQPAMHEWDQGGKALRFQRLAKELGYDKPQLDVAARPADLHVPTIALELTQGDG